MVILGIDPGLATIGFGVLDKDARGGVKVLDYGVILTPKEERLPTRLAMLEQSLKKLIDKYKPDEIALEELFFNTNTTTAILVAEARGVILLSAKLAGLTIAEYTPLQVKQAVVGYGRAEKRQVIAMVTSILKLPKPPKPDDTADALAIAICQGHAGSNVLGKFYTM